MSQNISTLPYESYGRILSATGPIIRAKGQFSIGEFCEIIKDNYEKLYAEVIGFQDSEAILTPYGSVEGVSRFSKIRKVADTFQIRVSDSLIGRVLNSLGEPIDSAGPIENTGDLRQVMAPAPDPMSRPVISEKFPLGVKSIDGILTCGVGQRMGIFAAAGGGKSTLMSMLIRFAEFDKCVIALIGERGREVREFIEMHVGPEGMKKSVVVVATSDRPAMEQVKAPYVATTIAEYYRERGENVLLLMDSLTRLARAQRQIGLAAGEPPTRRGFPPSVFEKLPPLLERAGLTETGSITALYTVLMEGDDMNEPISDEVRSILDGHIVLSGSLAQKGHYPAIDVLRSVSRVMNDIVTEEHRNAAQTLRSRLSKYNEIELLLKLGEFEFGKDQEADVAVNTVDSLNAFLKQQTHEKVSLDDSIAQLIALQ